MSQTAPGRDRGAHRSRLISSMIMFYIKVYTEISYAQFALDFDLLEDSQTSLFRCRPTARPDHLRKRDKLKSECYQRGTHLKLMPHVFSMAQTNSTTIRNRKEESGESTCEILWRVDWRFVSKDTVLTDTCVSEHKTIAELLSRFIDNSWKLGPTQHLFSGEERLDPQRLSVWLVNFQKEEVRVDASLSIREALRDQAILEYPTFVIRDIPTTEGVSQLEPVSA